jgi:hypothetical protein
MYISRKLVNGVYSYSLNQSYFDPPYWKSKVLLNLGTNPREYVHYYSDVAFSILVEEDLKKLGVQTNQFELEEVFYLFLTQDAQRWVDFSLNRKPIKRSTKRFSPSEVHFFDRRRLIALRLDHREPWRVEESFFPFYRELIEKSRDEIENYLWNFEDKLNYREKVRYLYAIFGLNHTPTQEDQDKLFIQRLCEIASDEVYRMGFSVDEVIKYYLCRYVWLYFDVIPIRRVPSFYLNMEESIYKEVAYVLNVSLETLYSLSKKEILKLFREKIKIYHPDLGGDREKFIRIRKVMEAFLKIRF